MRKVNESTFNRSRKMRGAFKPTLIILVILIFVVSLFFGAIGSFNDHEYVITVTDKDRIYTGSEDDRESKYLVFGDAEDGSSLVFENTDSVLRLKWNSSNVQGTLKVGNTYKVTVVGYRVPFLSMYENIIKVEEVSN